MHFLTFEESKQWCTDRVPLGPRGTPVHPREEQHHAIGDIPPGHAELTGFCQHLERALQPREHCLLWVTDWGIWPSSENEHLYYRLRQSYGDLRLLGEAPGHLFLGYERADLVSFLAVGIISGWDMHLVPSVGYTRAFVSHDEYVEFASDENNPALVAEFTNSLSIQPGPLSPGGFCEARRLEHCRQARRSFGNADL